MKRIYQFVLCMSVCMLMTLLVYAGQIKYKDVSLKSQKVIEREFKKVPKKVRRDIRKRGWKIYVGKYNLDRIYKTDKTDTETVTAGMCDYTNKKLVIRKCRYFDSHETAGFLLHEVGHYINSHVGTGLYSGSRKGLECYTKEKRKFDKLQTNLALATSEHNSENPSEYFAQSYMVYLFYPKELKKHCPYTYKMHRTIYKKYYQ